jgi:hypothetical protein
VHFVPIYLNLVCSNNGEGLIEFEYGFDGFESEFDGAVAFLVSAEVDFGGLFFVDRISPKQVTNQSRESRFLESVNLVHFLNGGHLRGYSAVHADVLFVDCRTQG